MPQVSFFCSKKALRTLTKVSWPFVTPAKGVSVDSLNGVLVDCVKACGGSKQVGPLLWPEKTPDAAQRLLLDCLNDDRPANLTPEAMLLLLRMAHQRGFHGGMGYVCERLGYAPPVAITPVDEVADLQRKFIEAQQAMARMVAQMQAASECMGQPVGALRAVRS